MTRLPSKLRVMGTALPPPPLGVSYVTGLPLNMRSEPSGARELYVDRSGCCRVAPGPYGPCAGVPAAAAAAAGAEVLGWPKGVEVGAVVVAAAAAAAGGAPNGVALTGWPKAVVGAGAAAGAPKGLAAGCCCGLPKGFTGAAAAGCPNGLEVAG